MQSSWYYCDLKPAWHFSSHSYSDPTQLFQMKYESCKMGHFHSYSYFSVNRFHTTSCHHIQSSYNVISVC